MDQIGKYTILGKIGQGAMGEVFKAHDAVLNRHVAIKTISADLTSDDTLRKRFEREAQSAAQLNHPNIITVFDFGEEHNKIYMAMELLEGTDLKNALGQRQIKSLDQKLDIMEQICDGLAFAHAADIVHRDLKPANVHILPSGQIKIMDFGLARLGGSEMTRTGMVMGTPHYMSPEQVRGERADSRSDVFSLGCVFYELLSQRKPFDADSMHGVLFKVMQEEPAPLAEVAPDTPLVLGQVLDKALAKDPAHRFQNAGELLAGVRRARQAIAAGRGDDPIADFEHPLPEPAPASRTIRPAPPGEPSRAGASAMRSQSTASRSHTVSRTQARPPAPSRNPWPIVAGAVVLLVAIGVGAWVLLREPEPAARVSASVAIAPPQVNELARTLAGNQAELARRRLQSGDYNEALRQAERALKLDPRNAEALDVQKQAGKVRDDAERAASAARTARTAGDKRGAAEALWSLLLLDPRHPAVAEVGPSVEADFKSRADEARRSMTESRAAAEKASAGGLETFKEGARLGREGDAAAKASQFATAARRYLEARTAFEKARRALQ